MTCLSLIFVASLAGCNATSGNGAGYERLTPSPATARTISRNDTRFARQVVAHNRKCAGDPACRK